MEPINALTTMLADYEKIMGEVDAATKAEQRAISDAQAKIDHVTHHTARKYGYDSLDDLKKCAAEACVAVGETVNGLKYQSVYKSPHFKWDSDLLEGIALVIPELNKARIEVKASSYIKKR